MPKLQRKPQVGDKVRVTEKFLEEKSYEGVVIELLSMQFTYILPNDKQRYCLYSEDWELIK